MANLMQDDTLIKNLSVSEKKDQNDDSDILKATVFKGKSEDTDKLINALHNI